MKTKNEEEKNLTNTENRETRFSQNPQEIIFFGVKAAKQLREVVKKGGWVVKIQDKEYLQFEAWQTLARFYGYTVKTIETKFVEYGPTRGFEAKVEVLDREGKTVGGAEAGCYSDEKQWQARPLYSLKSMAQTRASAKALRQILSWVVVLAGYKATPAEEIDEEILNVEQDRDQTTEQDDKITQAKRVLLKKLQASGGFPKEIDVDGLPTKTVTEEVAKIQEKNNKNMLNLDEKKFSGWSKEKCELCGRIITNAALKFSLARHGKKLCRPCQSAHRTSQARPID